MSVVVETRNLTKIFGMLRANDGINIKINQGTIHGIVGENGSGKSTLLKMLFGLYQPTSGEIFVDGIVRQWKSPLEAIDLGLGMVQQHFCLVDTISALDNIILGAEPTQSGGIISRAHALEKVMAVLPSPSLAVPWNERVENLTVGYRQRIEILKLLYRDARILFLDEPTAVLTPQEVDEFFGTLRALRDSGRTIVLITHKLREVFGLCDFVTVIRQGKVVGSSEISKTNPDAIINMMMGRERVPLAEKRPSPSQTAALSIRNLRDSNPRRGSCLGVDLTLHKGEILGIAGIEGSGQRNLFESLLGLRPYDGEINAFDKNFHNLSTREIRESGLGVIPEERIGEGLWGSESCYMNMVIGLEDQFSARGFFDFEKIQKETTNWSRIFDVRAGNLSDEVQLLSGGNQQKIIFAREVLGRAPKILICYQPTRGVDLGAIELIHSQLLKLRNEGVAVLLISSELDELIALSDRICVFFGGTVSREFVRGTYNAHEIGAAMTGTVQ